MELPISVITWRLGNNPIETIEKLLIDNERKNQILQKIHLLYDGVFYLNTCQRLILVINSSNREICREVEEIYLREIIKEPDETYKAEVFTGVQAFRHLSHIISSLDSVVIGEDQIQHQFKTALTESKPYLNDDLHTILQWVIKTGKRVREQSALRHGRSSTVALIIELYELTITEAKSIGIIGTGKMAQTLIKAINQLNTNLTIYSRMANRIGITILDYEVNSFDNMQNHDVLFTATTSEMPIIDETLVCKSKPCDILVFDLGMPRNCHASMALVDGITLIDMYELFDLSRKYSKEDNLHSVFEVLDREVKNAVRAYVKKTRSALVKSLRSDVLNYASDIKSEFLTEDVLEEKDFDQMINKVLHIAQKHVERAYLQ